ncbi:MAG: acyltransferase [Planctomycetota bacterium]|jgi:galactoside O-acetyltransferase
MPFLTEQEIHEIGFKHAGKDIKISSKASIYNPADISIQNNARIDDFCILSAGEGGIEIGRYVHVACYSSLIGKGKITLKDFSGISGRVSIYSSDDDYSGLFMAHPTIPDRYRNVSVGDVTLDSHVIIGTGAVILPGVCLGMGAVIGAMSLVKESCDAFCVYAGVPAVFVKWRKKNLLDLAKKLL